jgi:putative transposase
MRRKWKEEKIIEILREAEKSGSISETCRKHGVHESTFYVWRNKFGGLDLPEVKRLKELEKENAQLKQLAGDQALANQIMRDELKKRGWG